MFKLDASTFYIRWVLLGCLICSMANGQESSIIFRRVDDTTLEMTVQKGNELSVTHLKRPDINRLLSPYFNKELGKLRQALDASNFGTQLTADQFSLIEMILAQTAGLLDEWNMNVITDSSLAQLNAISPQLLVASNDLVVLPTFGHSGGDTTELKDCCAYRVRRKN